MSQGRTDPVASPISSSCTAGTIVWVAGEVPEDATGMVTWSDTDPHKVLEAAQSLIRSMTTNRPRRTPRRAMVFTTEALQRLNWSGRRTLNRVSREGRRLNIIVASADAPALH
jgi:hypothetical protein